MMADQNAQFESVKEAVTQGVSTKEAGIVRLWKAAIDAADREEKDWRKEADEVVAIYRSASEQKKNQAFNILYSNTETLLPAVYNSQPLPDIRRRYNDPGLAAKAVSDMLERGILYSLDQYDFDSAMRAVVFDAITAGRGVARIRYVPKVAGGTDPSQMVEGEGPESDAQEVEEHKLNDVEPGEQIISQSVEMEYVPWKNFRRGPGLTWADVPWVAFKHYLTREQIEDLAGEDIAKAIDLDYDTRSGENKDDRAKGAKDDSEIFLRACVWEIWDKTSGQVLFVAPCYEAGPIRVDDDPLKLTGFFPVPRPLHAIEPTCDLVPVPLYRSYKDLAEELNEVTIRIRRLVRQIRARGIYASSAADIEQIIRADDGELVPAQGLEQYVDGSGLEKAIAWWPIEAQAKVVTELVQHREAIKQTIYEVTGLSDILRGASSSSETATAQNIKNQWGSIRIQKVQAEVQRFCRDIFRMKAELIGQNFDMAILTQMTGVKVASQQDKMLAQQMAQQAQTMQQPVPPQAEEALKAPAAEEVEQMLRDDLMRSYRIDVETDSTVRGDLTRNQENMVQFVQGTAGYIQAVGPAVQAGLLPPDLAITIFGSFARNFRLGRQVDIALEQAAEAAAEMAKQPKPEQPNPELMKAEAEIKAKEADIQLKAKSAEMDMAMKDKEFQMAYAQMEREHEMEREKLLFEFELKREEHAMNMAFKGEEQAIKLDALKTNTMMGIERHGAELDMMARNASMAEEKNKATIEATKAKAKAKPAN